MRGLVRWLLILVVCLVGIGLYRGWFTLSRQNAPGDKVDIDVSVNKQKMKSDVQKVEKKVKEEVRKLEGKDKAPAGP
jgi:hypothetical protein